MNNDPKVTIDLLNKLETLGMDNAMFEPLHHFLNETIDSHRNHCLKLTKLFSSQTNIDVQRRLEFIFQSFQKYVGTSGNLKALGALATAAGAILPVKR